jgi:hypothetical protein
MSQTFFLPPFQIQFKYCNTLITYYLTPHIQAITTTLRRAVIFCDKRLELSSLSDFVPKHEPLHQKQWGCLFRWQLSLEYDIIPVSPNRYPAQGGGVTHWKL